MSELVRTGTRTSKTNLKIIGVNLPRGGCNKCLSGGVCVEIVVKNEGPSAVDLDVDDDGYVLGLGFS